MGTLDLLFLKLPMFLQEIQEITLAKQSTGMESQVYLVKYKSREGRTLSLILSYQKASKLELTLFIIWKKECGNVKTFLMMNWKQKPQYLCHNHKMLPVMRANLPTLI